jgi:hypothetical protein
MQMWGYRHCGVYFQRVLAVDDRGELFLKGKHIPWDHIVAFKRFPTPLGMFLRWPHTTFYLHDGRHFTVRTYLEEEGKRSRGHFTLVPRPNRAYGALVSLIQGRSGARSIWTLRAGKYEGVFLIGAALGAALAGVLGGGLSLELRLLIQMAALILGAYGGLVLQRVLRRRALAQYSRRHRHRQ